MNVFVCLFCVLRVNHWMAFRPEDYQMRTRTNKSLLVNSLNRVSWVLIDPQVNPLVLGINRKRLSASETSAEGNTWRDEGSSLIVKNIRHASVRLPCGRGQYFNTKLKVVSVGTCYYLLVLTGSIITVKLRSLIHFIFLHLSVNLLVYLALNVSVWSSLIFPMGKPDCSWLHNTRHFTYLTI